MKQTGQLSQTDTLLAFASLCVEETAKKAQCDYKEMYDRMHKVGLIQGLTEKLDPLHTQSREYVTDELLKTLLRLERPRKE